MKNKDILIIILINIILLILLCLITTNRYITILIEIILYLVYYIYLLFKKDYISYKVIVSNLIMCLIGILVIYIVNGKIDFVIDEDLSNIEESFSIYSFFIINILYSLIFTFTNVIKLLIKKIKE
ncbi:MAG: hypothetical protein MR938_04145 [Tenericutes bacterium]|nr:hypothetical protein [Mycoplasmatota bacterium]